MTPDGARNLVEETSNGKQNAAVGERRVGPWIVLAVVVGAFVVFVAKCGVPNVVSSGQSFVEKRAVSTLRTLHWAEGTFRSGGWLDEDGDGVGEFGTMLQLAAEAPAKDGAPIPASLVPVSVSRPDPSTGILDQQGYCFAIELPEGADARERGFVAWAWPARAVGGGSRAFCLDQDETILETAGPHGWVGCERHPPAGACSLHGAIPLRRWKGKTSVKPVGAP